MARAGQFKDRVTLEHWQDLGTLDRHGNPAGAGWAEFGKFWADFRETTGKERVAAGRIEAPDTATMWIRRGVKSAEIMPSFRVQARGKTWAIKGGPTDPDGARRIVAFLLETGGADK